MCEWLGKKRKRKREKDLLTKKNEKNWGLGFIFIIMKAGAEERKTG